jgi:hypothetical protein
LTNNKKRNYQTDNPVREMKQRDLIFQKFGGKCAYCGCELMKGWHVDEIEPVRRNQKWVNGKWVNDGCKHPERFHIDNQNPACASCNINKHSMSLEEFRKLISGFITHLNERNTQYKIAKRYGLVNETQKPIEFYFETLKN